MCELPCHTSLVPFVYINSTLFFSFAMLFQTVPFSFGKSNNNAEENSDCPFEFANVLGKSGSLTSSAYTAA